MARKRKMYFDTFLQKFDWKRWCFEQYGLSYEHFIEMDFSLKRGRVETKNGYKSTRQKNFVLKTFCWDLERLLWIAKLKNEPEEGNLAKLPVEVIAIIAGLLNPWSKYSLKPNLDETLQDFPKVSTIENVPAFSDASDSSSESEDEWKPE